MTTNRGLAGNVAATSGRSPVARLFASPLRPVLWATVFAGLLWLVLFISGVGAQDAIFEARGVEALQDFWGPADCLRGGYVRNDSIVWSGWFEPGDLAAGKTEPTGWSETAVYRVARRDRVYPAFALMPLKIVPMTWTGGWWWTALAGLLFAFSLVVAAGGRPWPLALVFSMPFVFSLERGNTVWLSAAAVALFLAWWNDARPGRRAVAAVALAVAAVMKVSPAVLGLLYLPEVFSTRFSRRSLAMPLLAAGCAVVLFVVPWLWVPDGFAGIPAFFVHAKVHANEVLVKADFGLVPLWHTVRMALHKPPYDPPVYVVARLSQVIGLALAVWGARRRDLLVLVGGMLFAAGNMYYYGALYLLPVLVLEAKRLGWKSALLWGALLCPLQVLPSYGVVNRTLAASWLVGLLALRLRAARKGAAA